MGVHWGGAGGSGYMLNWPHHVVVLTYTGCTYDTATQKLMWRATFGALRRGGAKPSRPLVPLYSDASSDCPTTPSAKRRRVSEECHAVRGRPRGPQRSVGVSALPRQRVVEMRMYS